MTSISIVMTLHNAERFARASIAAALAQDYGDYEVVALDDGSTDGTAAICSAIRDRRFRYVRCDRIGRARALNQAIAASAGRYVAVNDVDDISFRHRLSHTAGLLDRHPDLVLLGTDVERTDQFTARDTDSPMAGSQHAIEYIDPVRLYRSNPFVHSTVMFHKTAWSRVGGYDEGLRMCVDYDFFFRLGEIGRLAWSPVKTVRYYTHAESYFKRKSRRQYYSTLVRIRKRARRLLNLPLWARAYDFMPLATVVRAELVEAASRWRQAGMVSR